MDMFLNKWMWILFACFALAASSTAEERPAKSDTSQGTYRLPYADGTVIRVFDDFTTHGPRGGFLKSDKYPSAEGWLCRFVLRFI